MRKILYESKSFSVSSTESLSSHIFRATYAVNTYKGKEIEKVKKELGHKYAFTTINSYIKPEKRGLNLLEEKIKHNKKGIQIIKEK